MVTDAEPIPDLGLERLAKEIRSNYQLCGFGRESACDELGASGGSMSRMRRAGLPQSEMPTVMAWIQELQKRIALSSDVLDEIIEEHRQDFGRGPLADNATQSDGD